MLISWFANSAMIRSFDTSILQYERTRLRRGCRLIAVINLLSISFNGIAAAQCIDYYVETVQLMGSDFLPGYTRAVATSGTLAFVASASSGLDVYDVTNPQDPQVIGNTDTPGWGSDVFVYGAYAYVADGTVGLQVIDIADPHSPRIVGTVDTPGTARSVFVVGDYAYVMDDGIGMQVVDVADPASPRIVGDVAVPGAASDVFVVDKYAYVADGDAGLQVINITDPANPEIVGGVDTPGYASGLTASMNHVLIADGVAGLQVVDVSVPESPMIAGSFATPADARDVAVMGIYAHIAMRGCGWQVVDIADPQNIVDMGIHGDWYSETGVALMREYACVLENVYFGDWGWASCFCVYNIASPPGPQVIGAVATPDSALAVAVSGSHAFIVDDGDGLQVIDITDPSSPSIVGSVDIPMQAEHVVVSGDRAYATSRVSGLYAIDVTSPHNPRIMGSLDTPGVASDLAVAGNYVYIADGPQGFQVVDVADPAYPHIIGHCSTYGSAEGVVVVGTRAYLSLGNHGIEILDISYPPNPRTVGSNGWAIGPRLAVSGQYLYSMYLGSMRKIDISVPHAPQIAGSMILQRGSDVAVWGAYAYITLDAAEMVVVDLSDPSLPTVLGRIELPVRAGDVVLSGGYALVADGTAGLQILPMQCAINVPTLLASFTAAVWDPATGESPIPGMPSAPALQPRAVDVAWSFSEPRAPESMRLVTEYAGASRDIPFLPAPQGATGMSYIARDESPLLAGAPSVRYTLLHAASPGAWTALGDVTVVFGTSETPGALVPLLNVYPNPFNPSTQVSYEMARPGTARVTVHALTGALVRVLADGPQTAGAHFAAWDGRDGRGREMPAGGYVVRIATDAGTGAVKAVLVR